MSEKKLTGGWTKDAKGDYHPPVRVEPTIDISKVINDGRINVNRLMERISAECTKGGPVPRDLMSSLKECLILAFEIDNREERALKRTSSEDLQEMMSKSK